MSDAFFVTCDWLAEHIHDPEIQLLDARMAPIGQPDRDMVQEYRDGHLPGAVFFDIEALSDHSSPLPHTLPRPESFAVAMRELGVNSDRCLVVYDEGNLYSAPRAWWMLRTFGVENVRILEDGLAGWKQENRPLQPGDIALPEGEFEVKFNTAAVKRVTDVLLASHEGSAQIVDARSAARFDALVDEPRPGLRRGHMPGAHNMPWTDLVDNGRLKDPKTLQQLFTAIGVSAQRPVIASCGSGITAAVVVLALTVLGYPDITLYDGSWSEWGGRADLPVAP